MLLLLLVVSLLLSLINVSYSFKSNRILLSSSSSSIRMNKKLNVVNVDSITTIDPSYNLALGSAAISLIFCNIVNLPVIKNINGFNLPSKILSGASFFFGIFAVFFTFQASNLRFQYDSTSFSLVKSSGESLGEKIVVGGENKWAYKSFVNWNFLPSEEFPILVYFKETQTPRNNWVEAPIVVDNLEGQVHYFPAIARVDQLKNNFQLNKCTKIDESQNSFKTQLKGNIL